MRAPSVRVVLAGLVFAVVIVGGSIATRDDRLGGGPDAGSDQAPTTSAVPGASVPATSTAGLGGLADRLARLPAVASGELAGVLYVGGSCPPATLDLGTLETTRPGTEVCAAPGARFGVRLSDLQATDRVLPVVDLDGRPVETVRAPDGWDFWELAQEGIVVCRETQTFEGRLLRFGGGTTRLPSCPLARTRAGLMLYAGPDGQSVVDERGRPVAALTRPVEAGVSAVSEFGDDVVAVDRELYRHGRRIATIDQDGLLLSASRDGKVALVLGTDERLYLHHDGVVRAIDQQFHQGGTGVVAPDGRHILLQYDDTRMIKLDVATRRPLALLETGGFVFDWRPAVVEPA